MLNPRLHTIRLSEVADLARHAADTGLEAMTRISQAAEGDKAQYVTILAALAELSGRADALIASADAFEGIPEILNAIRNNARQRQLRQIESAPDV